MVFSFTPQRDLTGPHTPERMVWVSALMVLCVSAAAQQKIPPVEQMPAVTVSAMATNPVEKSYRKVLRGC